jgi:hypothetical protein
MFQTLLILFSIYGITHLLKDNSGPFGVLSWARNTLIRNSLVGTFFFGLFECVFCVGCHAGWIVYFLSGQVFQIQSLVLWILMGGTIGMIMDGIINKLFQE